MQESALFKILYMTHIWKKISNKGNCTGNHTGWLFFSAPTKNDSCRMKLKWNELIRQMSVLFCKAVVAGDGTTSNWIFPLINWQNSCWFWENKQSNLWQTSTENWIHSWTLFVSIHTCTYNMCVRARVCVCLHMSSVCMCECLLHSVCLGKAVTSAWPCMYYASKHIQESSIINNCFDSGDGIYLGPQTYIMHNAAVWKCSRTSFSFLIKEMCFSCSTQWQTASSFYTEIIYRHINNVSPVTPPSCHTWSPEQLK